MKTIIAITSAALVALSAGQALAQSDAPQVSVAYGDLDLSQASGRSALEDRVRKAVDLVCPAKPVNIELAKMRLYRACHETATVGARQQLAQVFAGRQLAAAEVRVSGGLN